MFFFFRLKNPRKYLMSKGKFDYRFVCINFLWLSWGLGWLISIINVEGISFKTVDTSLIMPRSVVLCIKPKERLTKVDDQSAKSSSTSCTRRCKRLLNVIDSIIASHTEPDECYVNAECSTMKSRAASSSAV